MRMIRYAIGVAGLLVCLFGSWTSLYALPPGRSLDQCRLDIWTARDGLPASEITSIAQTPDGFVWLATSSGLVRFDGSNFFTFNSRNTPGLTTDLVRSLAVRKDGTLWVGTEWGGFGPFVNGRFRPVWPSYRHWHRVTAMQEMADGSMVVSIVDDEPADTGIYRVVGDKIVPPPGALRSASAFSASGDGIVTATQYFGPRLMRTDGALSKFAPTNVFAGKAVTSVAVARDGSVWFGTEHYGLIRFLNGKYTVYTERDGLASDRINCLYADREGRLWVGTNNGVDQWTGDRFTGFGKIDGLYASDVSAISEDREGNLWVASGFGLNRFAATKLVPYSLERNSVSAGVYNISSAPSSDVWCASDLGLWKLQSTGAVYCKMPAGLPRDYADGVAAAHDGSLYVWFSKQSGFQVFDLPAPKGGNNNPAYLDWSGAKPQPVVDSMGKAPVVIPVSRAVVDSRGVTFFSNGFMTRVENCRVVERRYFNIGYEFCVVQVSSGDYWVGSTLGLAHIHDGISSLLNAGLPSSTHVLGIEASDPVRLWLATDKGLADFHNGRSILLGAAAGLPDTNLFQVVDDGHGALWIGYLHGLFSIRRSDIDAYESHLIKSVPYMSYSSSDGIRSYFNLFSSARTADGKLWFTGDDGVTMVDPAHIAINNFPPPVDLENATMDGKSLSTGSPSTVGPGDGRLHIGFAALSFAAPEQVRFRYRLEGFDRAWVETDRRSADYTNLPPGTYRFVVTACNNDGVWNPVGASIVFRLEPHYYQTFWFRALMLAALLAVVGLMYGWRIRQIVRHTEALEMQVAERTGELRLSNDQLQAAQEELTAQNHELEAARDYLEQRVALRTSELENAYDRTIEGWSFVMDLRDKETEGHSRRVTDITVLMAEAIGLTGDDIDNIRRGALLHDIGKMGIPDSVLLKPGPLTDEEWKVMRLHPVYAYDILSQIDYLKAAVNIPWCHHEKWDGTGYPRGLAGEEIPLPARMFSIVDVWDALRSDRPYRKGWPEEKVFDHLRSLAGTHFEPSLVELFFSVMALRHDVRPGDIAPAKAA